VQVESTPQLTKSQYRFCVWKRDKEKSMNQVEFWTEMSAILSEYDLLHHPFYEAWTEGALTLHDLREYACEYYQQVSFFPVYLKELSARLPDGELRKNVLDNLWDELGMHNDNRRAHNLLWVDFAMATGALPNEVFTRRPTREITLLLETFLALARTGTPAEALAAFYVYESQVPRVAKEKADALRTRYGLDEGACRYFTLHTTADVAHAMVWRQHLEKLLNEEPKAANSAIAAAERAAKALWGALDGIDALRGLNSSKPKPRLH
jgi:pyrroloquinoline-quinone synthase